MHINSMLFSTFAFPPANVFVKAKKWIHSFAIGGQLAYIVDRTFWPIHNTWKGREDTLRSSCLFIAKVREYHSGSCTDALSICSSCELHWNVRRDHTIETLRQLFVDRHAHAAGNIFNTWMTFLLSTHSAHFVTVVWTLGLFWTHDWIWTSSNDYGWWE